MKRVKHNQYVTIPDWFTGHSEIHEVREAEIIPTAPIGISNLYAGKTNVTLYNKFVLSEEELTKEVLSIIDKALNIVESEDIEAGTLVDAQGWATTEYITVVENTQMEITCAKHAQYGIVFYDYTKTIISTHSFIDEVDTPFVITVPTKTYFFRISSLSEDDSFKIIYQKPIAYNEEQFDAVHANTSDFTQIDETIPDGITSESFTFSSLNFLVENPLQLQVDTNDIIRLTLDYKNLPNAQANEMFEWDKRYAAFGYDPLTNTAHSYTDGVLDVEINEEGQEVPVLTEDITKWMYDEQAIDQWIIKTTRKRFSILDGLIEYDPDKDCFLFNKSIITSGGITMYADLGNVDIPSIYDGLPIDGTSIYWEEHTLEDGTIEKLLKSKTSLGAVTNVGEWADQIPEEDRLLVLKAGTNNWTPLLIDEIEGAGFSLVKEIGDGNAYTSFEMNEDEKILTLRKGIEFVTVDGNPQTITSKKNFTSGGLFVNGNQIVYDSAKGYWIFDGDMLVTGGVTTYYNNGEMDIPSMAEGLPWDNITIRYNATTKVIEVIEQDNQTTFENVTELGSGNAYTSFVVTNEGKSLTLVKGEEFATKVDFDEFNTSIDSKIEELEAKIEEGSDSNTGIEFYTSLPSLDLLESNVLYVIG